MFSVNSSSFVDGCHQWFVSTYYDWIPSILYSNLFRYLFHYTALYIYVLQLRTIIIWDNFQMDFHLKSSVYRLWDIWNFRSIETMDNHHTHHRRYSPFKPNAFWIHALFLLLRCKRWKHIYRKLHSLKQVL